MKKSKLLSILTAAAAIITTAGTYAVWDTLEDSTTEEITFRKPVTVTVNPDFNLTESQGTLGEYPVASGNVAFTVSNESGLAKSLKITPKVSGSNVSIDNFDITIKDTDGGDGILSGSATAGFTDTTLDSTNYKIEVKVNDDSVANKSVTITLDAVLE